MSVFDNIILATDSYKVQQRVCAHHPGALARPIKPKRRQTDPLACVPTLFFSCEQVSHYKQYPKGTEYVYSVRCARLLRSNELVDTCTSGARATESTCCRATC